MSLTKVSGAILKDPLNLGEVSIGGTLTYQDVTNVDSVGIITARSGINVSAGEIVVGSNIKIGNAGIITASGLDISGDIDVDGHTNLDNVSIAGVSTFASNLIVNGGISADTTLYVGSNLTITDKILHDGDTNTAIRFPQNDTISFETAGSQRLRITNVGQLLVETSSNYAEYNGTNSGWNGGHYFVLGSSGWGTAHFTDWDSDPTKNSYGGNSIYISRCKSDNVGTHSGGALSSGNPIARLIFNGSDGSNFRSAAYIEAAVDGAASTAVMPGRLTFWTSDNSAGAQPVERLRITSDGNIGAGGITTPLWTSGGGIHLNDNYGIGFGNGGSGRPDFQLMVTDGSKLEFRCGFGADTADIVMDTSGRLLVGTTSQSISSSELFEVKSTASGFSHFRNNSSSYATIYIDNEYSDTGFAPFLTFTDGGGNRGGIGQDNTDLLRITGQGGVSFYTSGTHGSGTERLRITSGGVIQTGSNTITGGNNLAIQNFAVKGVWSGASAIGKSIELISGYDSSVKMAAVGYNLTDVNLGSTYGGDLTFHTQPLYSSPTTPLPERMRISSSGYVTKPDTPCFIVRHTNAETYSANSYIDGPWTVTLNRGSHFNTSNGIFTAPVAGLYQLNMMMNNDYNNGANPSNFRIMVNNSLYAGLNFDQLDSHNRWFTHTLVGTLNISRNDTVRLHTSTQARVDNYNWNHWSMYLIG